MQFHEVGALAVFDGADLVGIITERDVLRAVGEGRNTEVATVDEYMTEDPVTVKVDDDASHAAALMVTLGARHLPVKDGGAVVGMLSAKDVLSIDAWPELVEAAEH